MSLFLKLCLPFLFIYNLSYASIPEFFGAGPITGALGGQYSASKRDPQNNVYHPSLLGQNKKVVFDFSFLQIQPTFNKIDNVLIKSSINDSSSTNQNGEVNTDYPTTNNFSLHASLPITGIGSLNISLFLPVFSLMETNSGDPHLPEYIMHRARYKRTQAYFNYAHPLTDAWAISIGGVLGFQAGGRVNSLLNLGTSSTGSLSSSRLKVEPEMSLILSTSYQTEERSLALTVQQEMENNLKIQTFIKTGQPVPTPNEMTIESMNYYDPWIVRLSYSELFIDSLKLIGTLEYQMWDGYSTPKMKLIKNEGIVLGSSEYENLQTKNILTPKLGLTYNFDESLVGALGFSYRPTPIKGDFSGPGNSIDTNSLSTSAGLSYQTNLFSQSMEFGGALQYTKLEEKTVTKTSNKEDGSSGTKLGSPTYTIGGDIIAFFVGLKWYL